MCSTTTRPGTERRVEIYRITGSNLLCVYFELMIFNGQRRTNRALLSLLLLFLLVMVVDVMCKCQ